MFFPYQVDVPMARWPIANWVLIGLTMIISLATLGAIETGDEWFLEYLVLQPENFHPLQLIGCTFTHAGIFHLLGNMLFLWVFGNAVNAKLGNWQYVLFYLGAGVCAGLVWLAIGPGVPAVGASAAIMGVVGAMFILYPLNEISVAYFLSLFYRGVFQMSTGWLIAIYVVLDVYGAVFKREAGIGYLAHVAGWVAGAAVTAALLWWHWIEMDRGEKSILQAAGWMICEDDHEPIRTIAPVKPQLKPRDRGPISLD
jgi:membrane associated rhomboid family serine protease